MKINLISHDNGVGLTMDVKICQEILQEKGWDCEFYEIKRSITPRRADVNIFFELLATRWYKTADLNLYFPNPEWFWFRRELRGIDIVLAKTRDCEKIFRAMGSTVIYTSFTSLDVRNSKIPRENTCLHLAGQSETKGTGQVYACWNYHPDLPKLYFLKSKKFDQYTAKIHNLHPIFGRLKEEEIRAFQNRCQFHICPSQYEGFGHYIWEAKSCGGIVVTTDGEPMNDFVKDGVDGYLAKVISRKRQQAGLLKIISYKTLYEAVKGIKALSQEKILEMSQASRRSWEENDQYFRKIFTKILETYGEQKQEITRRLHSAGGQGKILERPEIPFQDLAQERKHPMDK